MVYLDIEDICFFEVNAKYISSSELKTSEFSRVRSTSENFYVFNSRDEIYLVFTEKRQIFFLFYTIHRHFPIPLGDDVIDTLPVNSRVQSQ